MGRIAARFGVSRSFVCDVVRLARETGSVQPRPHAGGRRRVLSEADERVVLRLYAERPETRVVDLCERFEKETGVRVSYATMWRVLDRLGVSRRKRNQGVTSMATEAAEEAVESGETREGVASELDVRAVS